MKELGSPAARGIPDFIPLKCRFRNCFPNQNALTVYLMFVPQQIIWDFFFIDCCNFIYDPLCLLSLPLSEQPPCRLWNPPGEICHHTSGGQKQDPNKNTIERIDYAPDVKQHEALRPSQDVLGGSPVSDEVDQAGRDTLSQSCKLLTQTGRQ